MRSVSQKNERQNIVLRFKEFGFSWTYEMASFIRQIIFEEDQSLIDITEYFENIDDEFKARSLKPSKVTHLHDLIGTSIFSYVEYWERHTDFDDELTTLLESYEISIKKGDNLGELVIEKVVPRVTEEVFTILYPDRELLLKLNEIISDHICTLLQKDHPDFLAKDGVVLRNSYWPIWLQRAVIFRDQGRCCFCLCDLTGLLVAGAEEHMDHVVPLHLGGTNDPTNIQLLCEACNKSKGANPGKTTKRQHLFW